MRTVLKLVLVALAALLAGCAATGPKYSEAQANFPRLAAGEARVFFYRDSMMGAALTPDVRVDGRTVGPLQSGSFFFVDLPAGRHTASASTEVDANVDFSAQEGDTVYISLSIGMGLVVGRPHLTVRMASEANQALPSLAYGGSRPLSPSTSGASGTARQWPPISAKPGGSATPPATARSPAPSSGVTMDDLRGLLPATR